MDQLQCNSSRNNQRPRRSQPTHVASLTHRAVRQPAVSTYRIGEPTSGRSHDTLTPSKLLPSPSSSLRVSRSSWRDLHLSFSRNRDLIRRRSARRSADHPSSAPRRCHASPGRPRLSSKRFRTLGGGRWHLHLSQNRCGIPQSLGSGARSIRAAPNDICPKGPPLQSDDVHDASDHMATDALDHRNPREMRYCRALIHAPSA